jgi:hypothetical protein
MSALKILKVTEHFTVNSYETYLRNTPRVNKTLYIQYFLEMLSGWLLVHFEEI